MQPIQLADFTVVHAPLVATTKLRLAGFVGEAETNILMACALYDLISSLKDSTHVVDPDAFAALPEDWRPGRMHRDLQAILRTCASIDGLSMVVTWTDPITGHSEEL